MRILFWGTPEFALPSLRALEEEGHDIVGVVTQPDRPAGRGRELRESPVKVAAREEGHRILTPERPRGEDFRDRLAELKPEISVVVAYGHILPGPVLEIPERGSINVHASLLPKLRGAAPVTWAVARGHEMSGVTVMRMVEEMDAGPILFQAEEPIGPDETAAELGARLAEVGAQALVEALALMEADALDAVEQDESEATFAPKVDRETARVDWDTDPTSVANWIRGMDQIPGAWSRLEGDPVKLFRPEPLVGAEHGRPPGTVLAADPDEGLVVAAAGGAVRVGEVQPAGKRRMPAADWLRGRGAEKGQRFE